MCGKPHPEGFRTVLHSNRVCRQLLRDKPAMIRHRQGPNEKQVFAVTLRRRHHDVKNGVTACSVSKADPGCSSFVPLCVPEGQFVSSGRLLWFELISQSARPKNSQSGQQSNIILDVAKLAGHAQPLRALPFARQPSRSQRALVSPKSFRKSAHLHQVYKCAQRIVGSD
jgi:hypothetical protein